MELASFIIGFLGFATSLVGVVITVRLSKRTNEIKIEIEKRYSKSLALFKYSEKKNEYSAILKRIRETLFDCGSSDISARDLSDLDLTLHKIRSDIMNIDDEKTKDLESTISNVIDMLNNTVMETENKNITIATSLSEIISFLESYTHFGG